MTTEQIYYLLNDITSEATGTQNLAIRDGYKLVDLGTTITNSETLTKGFLTGLIDKVTKTIIMSRQYEKQDRRGINKETLTYGAIVEMISIERGETTENLSWKQNDTTCPYSKTNPNYTVTTTIAQGNDTFEYDVIIYDYQLNSAFLNEKNMAAFVEGVFETVKNSLEIYLENIESTVINTSACRVYNSNTGNTVVKLATLYNTLNGYTSSDTGYVTPITQSNNNDSTINSALSNRDFLRFVYTYISKIKKGMRKPSVLFNPAGKERWSTNPVVEVISDVNERFNLLPNFDPLADGIKGDSIYYWQGTGTSVGYANNMQISQRIDGNTEVNIYGCIAMIRDDKAVGMLRDFPRTRSLYDPSHEKTYFYNKMDIRYYSKADENFVVFTLE